METREDHQRRIEELRKQGSPNLNEALADYAHQYVSTAREWNEWLETCKGNVDESVQIYTLWLSQRCDPVVWEQYLSFLTDSNVPREIITAAMQKAFIETLHLVQGNDAIWQIYLNWFEIMEEDKSVVKDAFLQKLHAPHLSLQNTFSMFSQFISRNFDNYDQEMNSASKVVDSTNKFVDSIMHNEIRSTKESSPEFWLTYLDSESKRNKKNRSFPLMNGIFQRGISHDQSDDWIPFWLRFLEILVEFNSSASTMKLFARNFVKYFPESCTAWCEYLCQLTVDEEDLFSEARNKALKLMETSPYSEWKTLALQILRFEFLCMMQSGSDSIGEWFFQDIQRFWDMALLQQDALHSVERYIVSLHQAMNETDRCRELLLSLTKKFPDQAEMWLLSFEFECKHGTHESADKIIKAAANRSLILDWPERVLDEWQRYTLLNGDTESVRQARLRSAQYLQQVYMRREEEESAQNRKRKTSIDDEPKKKLKKEERPHRDRENLCVSVRNAVGATEDEVKSVFGSCGEIRSVTMGSEMFSVEFTDRQGVEKALLKTGTIMRDNSIQVERSMNTTLWVTNFPPLFSELEVRSLFEVHGSVISVRFPSLSKNSRRRFCYVEFASSNDAKVASEALNGKELIEGDNRYKLVVKLSDPNQKDPRNTIDGEEIIVKNLHFNKVDKQVLASLADEYGQVEKVYLPSKNSARKNDGYGFVLFKAKESAQRAATGLNGKELYGRLLEVSVTRPRAPAASNFQDSAERTISIRNVPTSVSDADLKAKLAEVGPVRRLTRDSNEALVEYEKVADAGFAIMRLNGVEVGGENVVVTAQSGSSKKGPSKIMASPSVRRKLTPKVKKSNSDFRAMLN